MERVTVIDHSIARAILTTMRDKNTGQVEFRNGMVRLGRIIGYEIAKSMEVQHISVETPLGKMASGVRIPVLDHAVIVQVLRAAMPLAQGLVDIFASARMGVVSARRIEESHRAGSEDFSIEINYVRVPRLLPGDMLIVADPALATGSTITAVLRRVLTGSAPGKIIIASVLATRTGIERVLRSYPAAEIYTVAIDPEIDDMGYIVPGLGDAGDRAFGGP